MTSASKWRLLNERCSVMIGSLVSSFSPTITDPFSFCNTALNNTLKHAQAKIVTVRICANAQAVEIEIADDGQGFDPDEVDGKGGMGLLSMRERAERLGGSLTILSARGQGTRIHVRLEDRNAPGFASQFKEFY